MKLIGLDPLGTFYRGALPGSLHAGWLDPRGAPSFGSVILPGNAGIDWALTIALNSAATGGTSNLNSEVPSRAPGPRPLRGSVAGGAGAGTSVFWA